jgi:glycosyltransferase involved in cell wall biosynthesis
MKFCVFPNDSLLSYFKKGEIKYGYFNPGNFFDEIHVISLFDEEIDENKIKEMGGNAKFKIHKLGKVNLKNYKNFEGKVTEVVREINPDLIRAYNPLIQGWLATTTAKKLNIPSIISLHTNYDEQRDFAKKKRNYFKYLKLLYTYKKLEKSALQRSNAVICVYESIVPYIKKIGIKKYHIIYNKVNLEKFTKPHNKKKFFDIPTIISVGQLIEHKPRKNLIKAIKDLDVILIIIGDGPDFNSLNNLTKSLKIQNKVKFIQNIPNEELPEYYLSADIFALPLEISYGIPIPVLEAMSCGLPIVLSKHSKASSEIIDDAILFVDNNSDDFKVVFQKILNEKKFENKMKAKSLSIIKKMNGKIMEKKEIELYKQLIK